MGEIWVTQQIHLDRDFNSMLYWYPKVYPLAVTPKTEFVMVDTGKIYSLLMGMGEDTGVELELMEMNLLSAGRKIGYPLFLRTDLASGKHSWRETCYVATEEHLVPHAYNVAEANEMAGIFGLDYRAFALREFLHLEAPFRAFLDMPIGKEFRVFAKEGDVCCIHPYWPKRAIRFHGEEPENWQNELAKLSVFDIEDYQVVIMEIVRVVSEAVENTWWSIDICKTIDKGWWLTDMALGFMSYHWDGCSEIERIATDSVNWLISKQYTEEHAKKTVDMYTRARRSG
jgi:hypothetical protein